MTFTYQDFPATMVTGKRIYQISQEKYYPSITTVLGGTLEPAKANALENWRKRIGHAKADQVSTAAANRGTNMHTMLERAVRGDDPKIEEFPVEHVNMFKSLRLELRKINKVYGQEVVLYSDILGVAGRCDLIAEYQGELAVVDYKSSTRAKSADEIGDYWLQTAFYGIAHNEMFGTDIKKLVIMMGVENKLPMIFRKTIDDELLLKLAERVSEFYERL